MKLRVKLQGQSQVIDLQNREPEEVSLAELSNIVAARFGLENGDFQLSLNKADALPTNEEPISSVGIISGDLLHIIGHLRDNIRSTVRTAQPTPSTVSNTAGSLVQQSSDISIASASPSVSQAEVEDQEKVANVDVDSNTSLSVPQDSSHVNRSMLEPLVVRESTATQVPVMLEQMYCSAACISATDALWVAVHTLMLEAGFVNTQDSDITQMPSNWKQAGYYKCAYKLRLPADQSLVCSVVGVVLGGSLVVHGLCGSDSSFKTDQLQLKASEYVDNLSQSVPQVYVALDRLSRLFKDTICLPLESELSSASGMSCGPGFSSLPYEVKVRIISALDVLTLCRLAQTRSDMGALARDRVVWRHIYIRDFGRPNNSAVTRDWYELYKDAFLEKREAERRRREFMLEQPRPPFLIPGVFEPRHNPGIRFPPRMIGGDYDLHPEFSAGGVPDPMGMPFGRGRGRGPSSTRPHAGLDILNPLCGDPLGQGLAGRPRIGGRTPNLTGSPFGSGSMFRSPFM